VSEADKDNEGQGNRGADPLGGHIHIAIIRAVMQIETGIPHAVREESEKVETPRIRFPATTSLTLY
jgi:hypothetical protein